MKRLNLDTKTLTSRGFYQLLLYAVLLGALVGLATSAFLLIEHGLTDLIWEKIPERIGTFALYSLVICTLGGLLVGLCQRFLGDYPKPMREALEDVRTEGGFDVKHVPHGVVTSLVSLAFGAALGPEAALIGLAGGLSTWVAQRLKAKAQQAHAITYFGVSGALGAFFHSPFGSAALPLESPEGDELPSAWTLIPGIFAGATGLFVTMHLAGSVLRGSYDYLPYSSPMDGSDLLVAIPFAILGALIGQLYHLLSKGISRLVQPIKQWNITCGIIGGVLLGLLATFSPLVLFSGQSGLNDLFQHGAEIGSGILILTGLAKLLALGICVATGWKGGEFFPVMFAGAAVGMGCAYLFPGINPMVGTATVMTAATAAMLRKPLATILIIILYMPASVIFPISVGALIGATVSFSKLLGRKKINRSTEK